jgi:hypothetical protein
MCSIRNRGRGVSPRHRVRTGLGPTHPVVLSLKARPHYSCSCYSLYTLRVNIRILTRRNLASNWSSVDEDFRAQVKARRVSWRAQDWRAPTRARIMWTHFRQCAAVPPSPVSTSLAHRFSSVKMAKRLETAWYWRRWVCRGGIGHN